MSPHYKAIGHFRIKYKRIIDRIETHMNMQMRAESWDMDDQRRLEQLHAQRVTAQIEFLGEVGK